MVNHGCRTLAVSTKISAYRHNAASAGQRHEVGMYFYKAAFTHSRWASLPAAFHPIRGLTLLFR